jgi:hypothetical protein
MGTYGGILPQQMVVRGWLSMKRKIAAIFAADIAGYSHAFVDCSNGRRTGFADKR